MADQNKLGSEYRLCEVAQQAGHFEEITATEGLTRRKVSELFDAFNFQGSWPLRKNVCTPSHV